MGSITRVNMAWKTVCGDCLASYYVSGAAGRFGSVKSEAGLHDAELRA